MCCTLKHDTLTFTIAIHIAMFAMFYFHRFSVSIKLPMLTIRNNANRKYAFLKHILSYAIILSSCIKCCHAYNYIQIFIQVYVSIMIRVWVKTFPIPIMFHSNRLTHELIIIIICSQLSNSFSQNRFVHITFISYSFITNQCY